MSGPRRPTFLILGAPKCGTTTLHHVLASHPDVFMAPSKDPLFFELDAEYRLGPEAYWERHFAAWAGEPAVGEARPTKLMLPYVPERVLATAPDARLVAILRDPADRVFSHWWMRRCNGLETRPLEEALDANEAAIRDGRTFEGEAGAAAWRDHLDPATTTAPVYLEFGDYAAQLERWFAAFGRERVLTVFFDDLARDPGATFRAVFAFLGVDPSHPAPEAPVHNRGLPDFALPGLALDRRLGLSRAIPPGLAREIRRRLPGWGARPRLDPAIRARLVARYADGIRALEEIAGRDLRSWRSAPPTP